MYKKRLKIFIAILLLLVVVDAAKFLIFGGTTLINWHSFVHPAWVITAIALYFIGIVINAKWFWNVLLALYSVVVLLAIMNQYVPFTGVITANCVVFNLFFIPLYLFLGSTDVL
jgi:hypothetical protein